MAFTLEGWISWIVKMVRFSRCIHIRHVFHSSVKIQDPSFKYFTIWRHLSSVKKGDTHSKLEYYYAMKSLRSKDLLGLVFFRQVKYNNMYLCIRNTHSSWAAHTVTGFYMKTLFSEGEVGVGSQEVFTDNSLLWK